MTAKAPTPIPEGMNRPKAPTAPPKPPLMRVGANGVPCPLCGSGMKPSWLWLIKSKGCYQSDCTNYWEMK